MVKTRIVIAPNFSASLAVSDAAGGKLFSVREKSFYTRSAHPKRRDRNFLSISNPAFWHARCQLLVAKFHKRRSRRGKEADGECKSPPPYLGGYRLSGFQAAGEISGLEPRGSALRLAAEGVRE